MRISPLPSYERLHELFVYETDTGLLRWKVNRSPKKIGDIAGVQRPNRGHIQVSIDNKLYRAHRIIWKMMTGDEPQIQIEHRDLNYGNNIWGNLRLSTQSQNMANIGIPKHNKSGLKGVSRYRAGEAYGKPWQAGIGKEGKRYHIGHFATKEEAHAAYCEAAERLFGEFARAA